LDDLLADLPSLESQGIASSLPVHNANKLESENNVLKQRVAQLEAELENARQEI
jgi:hypothetical protein